MSTRATYTFADSYGSYTVYKHHCGEPPAGLQWIANAIPHTWELPEFAAAEFAAAFIAGNPWISPGGVRLTTGPDSILDASYRYTVTCRDGALHVHIWDVYGDKFESGTLEELIDKHLQDL